MNTREPSIGDSHIFTRAPDSKCYQCGESVHSESFETRMEIVEGKKEYFHDDGCFDNFLDESDLFECAQCLEVFEIYEIEGAGGDLYCEECA